MTFFNDLLQRDKLLSQSVAKLIIGSDGTICTGFLVTGDLMLTAFHCLAEHSAAFKRSRNATSILCDDVRAQFDFHTIHDTGRVPFAVCRRVLAYGDYAHDEVTKENGDFALLKFNAADITLSDPGHPPRPHLTIKQLPPSPTAMVEIFQHPLGFPLQASYCTVDLGVSSSQASYNCASYEGSSGAPVIDWTTGNVIVLHTTGGAQDFDPQPCASPTAPACVQSANHGTPIQTIWPKLSSVLD